MEGEKQTNTPELFISTNYANFNVFPWDLSLKPGKHPPKKVEEKNWKCVRFFVKK